MTTIAIRSGVMAADSRETNGQRIDSNHVQKIWRLSDGGLLGGAGSAVACELLKREMERVLKQYQKKKGEKTLPTSVKGCIALLLDPTGQLWYYEKCHWIDLSKKAYPYYAIGSGSDFALAAMDMGASAQKAVSIAIRRDKSSGGKVKSLKLRR